MAVLTKININTASREELAGILGLGPDLADDIVNYRELYGPFKNWEDLKHIEGITDSVIEEMQNSGATI